MTIIQKLTMNISELILETYEYLTLAHVTIRILQWFDLD